MFPCPRSIRSTIEGGRGCNKCVPVLRGNGTKIAPTGYIFDQPPGGMSWVRGKLAGHVGGHVVLSPEEGVLVTSPGTESSYPRPSQLLNNSFVSENLVSRDGFGSPVPRQPAHLHTQAESGAYIRNSSRFLQRRPLLYLKRPDAIESVPSLSDHALGYRWCSLPRVRRHKASKPLGSSEQVLPFCRSPWTN